MSDLNPLFIRSCTMLWGQRWQSEAGRALGISDRHIRRLAAGQAAVTPGMITELHQLADEHLRQLQATVNDLAVAKNRAV